MMGEEMVKSQEKSEEKVNEERDKPSAEAIEEENRKIRWLRIQTNFVQAVLYQDRSLNPARARSLIYQFRERVLQVFPTKAGTFDLILLPRFERILRERWGSENDVRVH